MRTLLFVLLASFSVSSTAPAIAQSALGIRSLEVSLGGVDDEADHFRGDASAIVDVAITDHHGFQGDLTFSDTLTGGIGTLSAHLYMTPKDGQKYGLFAALSDVDGRSMLYGSLGAEGMLSLSERTSVEGRAGIGWADVDGLDYIFAGVSMAHQLTPAIELEMSLDIADFDEAGLSATAYDFGLGATYSPDDSALGAYVKVRQSNLTDHSSATRIGLGLSITLGAAGGTNPHTRLFRTADPVAPLVRRDLW